MKLGQKNSPIRANAPLRLRNTGKRGERGAALLIALLLLTLISALSVGMYISMSSDSLINGFYRNQQGAYYAANSGLTVALQYLESQVTAAEAGTFTAGTPPINSATVTSNALTALSSKFGGGTFYPINTGAANGSWPTKFTILGPQTTFTLSGGAPVGSVPNTLGQDTAYKYTFNYTITAVGESVGSEQSTLQENGTIVLNETDTNASLINFAGYGAFVDQYSPCLGALAPGLFTGPTFTNGAWNFGEFSTQYVFTDPVGQANADASYWTSTGCHNSPTTSYTQGSERIAPTFQAGYNLGQTAIPLPQNVFNQEEAVLDKTGASCPPSGTCGPSSAPAPTTLSADLKNVSGTAFPATAPSSGVYLPYSTSSSTCPSSVSPPCFTGGGIFVQGNAAVKLTATNDTAGNPTQTYTITQGSTVTTVVVNDVTNTTTISSGSSNQVINGVPQEVDPTGVNPTIDATMLYVSGSITGLTGPYGGSAGTTIEPAVQDGTRLTIATPGNVDITGDVTYKEEPVTTSATGSTPVDTLIAANSNAGVLGIATSGGNINLDITNDPAATCHSCTPNIEVDGSLAAMSLSGGVGGFTQSGPAINTFNNTGGQIQGNIFGANISIENTYFDRRFTSGVLPPWFPSTTITATAGAPIYSQTSSLTQWINLSAVNASQ